MRGVGYSLETALADLIDNSLSAGADQIAIEFDWGDGSPRATIIDNGCGMNAATMIEAMRFGGRGPEAARSVVDLGRFGLGLKTASLSQCRRLRVASKTEQGICSFTWDIDHIASEGDDWSLIEDNDDLPPQIKAAFATATTGTAVVWEKIDFGRKIDKPDHAAFLADLARAERHVAMVFHRFIQGDARRVCIALCGRTVQAWDPFLEIHPSTITFPEQRIQSPGGLILVRGFVLPHRDKFRTEAEFDAAGGPGGWAQQQGFYIYRQKRLLSAGGWLGLGGSRAWTRDETSRLARIKIDIPNSADQEWRIDIRKAIARPPDATRRRLQQLAADVRKKAREVFVHRGAYGPRPKAAELRKLWLTSPPGTRPPYTISRDHDFVAEITAALRPADRKLFEALLELIERTVPLERVWLDVTENGVPAVVDEGEELEASARAMIAILEQRGIPRAEAVARVLTIDPFDQSETLRGRLLPTASKARR